MNKLLSLVLALGFIASPVSALTVGTKSDTSGSVQAGSGVNVNVSSETRVQSDTEANASSDSDSDDATNATWEVDATGPTIILAADVDGDTEIDMSVKSSAAVNSKATLNTYAKTVVKADTDIRDVSLSENEVAVSHKEYARLFGILPIKVYARAYVKSNGSVQVKFPWYAFARAEKSSLESDIAAKIHADVNTQTKLAAKTQAVVLAKTAAAMKSHFDAETSGDATAKVQ